jgi:hypothetical protein
MTNKEFVDAVLHLYASTPVRNDVLGEQEYYEGTAAFFDAIGELKRPIAEVHSSTIYYSLVDCGDGSAYPAWFESSALADWHAEHQEGWGEPCTGCVTATSTTPVTFQKSLETVTSVGKELEENQSDDLEAFYDEFG